MKDNKEKFITKCGGRKEYPNRIKISKNKNTRQNEPKKNK